MIKGVTKNLQATSPTCTRSPLRESMQSGSNLAKNPSTENLASSASMATALVTTNSTTVSLSDSSHSGYLNGDLSVESKAQLKLTFKRNKAPSDTASIPSPSTKPDDNSKSNDLQGSGVSILSMHPDSSSLHRHPAVNGKMLPTASSSSHSTHNEQTRSGSKRTSGSLASGKRPKSASKRDRNATSKPSSMLSLGSSASSSLVNGRPSSSERSHDPYQFSVKKEDETILPPKKLRLDSSLSRLSERSESHRDQATNTRNQSTSVDADLLGPCEPGTHINLDGYVCVETLTGMLMVSVMWRGRTYLGTLMDSSSHGFSPPIPPSYVYASQRYVSGMDASGASSSSSANGRNQRGRGKRRCGFTPTSGARHSRKGRRNPRGSPVTVASSSHGGLLGGGDDSNEESQSRGESPASENAMDDEEAVMRYQCPQTGCHKRFKEVKAMKFHHDECHTKKPVTEAFSDSETSREKRREKSGKSASKSKKHSSSSSLSASDSAVAVVAAAAAAAAASSCSSSLKTPSVEVKTEPPSSASNPPVSQFAGDVKSEAAAAAAAAADAIAADAMVPPAFFKAPVNNGGLGSPPVLAYSPSSPSVSSLPASPANGLKLPAANTAPPEILSLPLHSAATHPGNTTKGSDLSVRIPATNNLMMRVGVSSSAGAVSVNTSSTSSSRTVAAVTVPVTTIPVMKPSTVASASASASSSSTLVHSGKKMGSKESKSGGGGVGGSSSSGGSSKNAASRALSASGSGQTITASSVAIPRASSPSAQSQGGCPSSLKPIQPKPQAAAAASSPSPSSGAKPLTPTASPAVAVNAADANAAKRASLSSTSSSSAVGGNVNPSRKRKKSSGVAVDSSGKRLSISSTCPTGRTATAKPSVSGAKRINTDVDGSLAGAEGSSSNHGDRASPAYSDISDDNESPIPILEKEGDVKLLGDSVASGDEVGKASEQASGGGAFYNTPPSLVPFSVYAGEQPVPVGGGNNNGAAGPAANSNSSSNNSGSNANNGGGKNGGAIAPPVAVSGRPVPSVVKKSAEANASKQVRSTATVIPGTSPLPLKRKPEPEEAEKPAVDGKPAADAGKPAKEPPNLTKIPSSLTLTLPSSSAPSSSSSSSSTAVTTPSVAKPTPLNPLSPSRAASEVPASAPAVVTPGPLVGVARAASDLYTAARPDHLRTPPSFHPGPPFAAQFAAHMSPSALGPQGPPGFPPYSEALMRFVPNGPHPPGHPFAGYPYGEPFFQPPVSSAPQPHKIHELVEKGGVVSCASTSSTCTSTAAAAAAAAAASCSASASGGPASNSKAAASDAACPVSAAAAALDLQAAKSFADMAVAIRHHASMVPNHGGLQQGPTHAGMVPAHFQFGGGIPPAHMTGPPFAAIQQHSLPPGHPPGHAGPDPFFSPSSIVNHPLYK